MKFARSPIVFDKTESGVWLARDIEERISMLDNLVELIVFTPKGSFEGDPDFGFEYWNHEFSNINYRQFNNDQFGIERKSINNGVTKKECEQSIRQSLNSYAPILKQVMVTMELKSVEEERQKISEAINRKTPDERKQSSKYMVNLLIGGVVDDGLGTTCIYNKNVKFLIEPTAKKYNI